MAAHVPSMRADLLIREANQRMRRRRLLLAVLLASVLALSIGLTVALRSAGSPALAGAVWLPHGVREIDIRSQTFASHPHSLRHPFSPRPPLSLRITDPSEVARIAGWFNALVRSPREVRLSDDATVACVNGIPATVEFTFRGASGKKLATANSTPGMAWYCAAIQFTAGAHRAAFLLDRFTLGVDPSKLSGRDEANSFIGRVQELLGVKFQQSPVILG